MPRCCIPTRVEFAATSSTVIAYTAPLRDKYGSTPKIYVLYFDPVTSDFYYAPWYTVIKFNGTQITVDHGGPNSGIVVVT